ARRSGSTMGFWLCAFVGPTSQTWREYIERPGRQRDASAGPRQPLLHQGAAGHRCEKRVPLRGLLLPFRRLAREELPLLHHLLSPAAHHQPVLVPAMTFGDIRRVLDEAKEPADVAVDAGLPQTVGLASEQGEILVRLGGEHRQRALVAPHAL